MDERDGQEPRHHHLCRVVDHQGGHHGLAILWQARKRSLKRHATMDADTKDKECLFLKDKVYLLEMQVSILQKRIKKQQKKPRYTMRERLLILWHMSVTPLEGPRTGWINNALESAIETHGAPKHIVSDQVKVYTGEVFAKLLEQRNIKARLGVLGKNGSISVTERVIKTLKYEWLKRVPIIKNFDDP